MTQPREGVTEGQGDPALTIGSILAQSTARAPGRAAIEEGDRVLTFAQLLEQAQRLASCLADLGIGKGDTVALLLPNCSAFIVAHYALARMGAVIAPVNAQLKGRLLREALELTEAACVVTTAAFEGALHALSPRPSALRFTLSLNEDAAASGEIAVSAPTTSGFERSGPPRLWKDLSARDPKAEVGPHDPAILFTTSGTTGKPKGILVTHHQAVVGITAWLPRWRYDPDTACMMVAPFFHVIYNPLIIGAHLCLGRAVVLGNLQTRAAAREVERTRATAISGSPALLIQLLNDRAIAERDLSSLRAIIFGTAPTPVPIIQGLRRRLPAATLYNCYGLTETCTAVSCLGSDEMEGRETSVGRPFACVETSIRDPEHRELPRGEIGELYLRGPHVIKSYYKAPEANATRFHDGWLRTGDIGYFDQDSYLYLLGRSDDMINVGGEKIYPRDIENVLFKHPGVFDAAVVAVEDVARGQVVKAFVVPSEGQTLDLASLRQLCIKSLPPAFVPRSYEIVDELPRTAVGKVLRRELARGASESKDRKPAVP